LFIEKGDQLPTNSLKLMVLLPGSLILRCHDDSIGNALFVIFRLHSKGELNKLNKISYFSRETFRVLKEKEGANMTNTGHGSWFSTSWEHKRGVSWLLGRLMKKAHLRRYPAASPSRRRGKKSLLIRRDATPHPSSLRRTTKYASFLRISGALHLGISEQPVEKYFSATS
jgi:hypothetical protein